MIDPPVVEALDSTTAACSDCGSSTTGPGFDVSGSDGPGTGVERLAAGDRHGALRTDRIDIGDVDRVRAVGARSGPRHRARRDGDGSRADHSARAGTR